MNALLHVTLLAFVPVGLPPWPCAQSSHCFPESTICRRAAHTFVTPRGYPGAAQPAVRSDTGNR